MPLHPLYDARLNALDVAVFDLETSGLYPHLHRIIQIAVVKVSGMSLGKGWSTLVDPGPAHRPIDDAITDLTKIKDADLTGQPGEAEALTAFADRVGTRIVVGHNIRAFDIPFVNAAADRHGIAVQTTYYLDTIRLMRRLVPGLPAYKLADCATYFGIPFNPDDLHDALADTSLTASVYLRQVELLEEKDVLTFGQVLDFLS